MGVIDAIENDLPDVIIAEGDIRQAAAFSITDPAAFEAAGAGSPSSEMFRAVASRRS